MNPDQTKILARWRLILGRYADRNISGAQTLDRMQRRMDNALDFLYGREYAGRGVRGREKPSERLGGGLGPSQMVIPRWLGEVRKLFPKQSVEVIEKHALRRYGMTELIQDAATLKKLEPNRALLKAVLTFKGQMKAPVLEEAKRIIRQVVDEITAKLKQDVQNALTGRINKFSHTPQKSAKNLDWHGTIRRNLKNYDPHLGKIVLNEVRFFARVRRSMLWDIILCVDQSGSMLNSVIHSAVLAGILCRLPMLNVKLVIFDTSVVDLSEYVDDPVETLMNVQLGGGTDIGKALRYCEQLIKNPCRTVLILISDFEEVASPQVLMAACRRLAEAGVTLLGLASLDDEVEPYCDRKMAERMAENGMNIAALTPKHLADWLAKVIV